MPRVILITGAGRGFGHAMAQTFLSAGEHVVATTRNPTDTDMAFTNTTSENYLPFKLDVTISSDVTSAFAAAVEKFGRIDVVINNAGFGLIGPLKTLTDEQIKQQFDSNFFSVVGVTRKAIETMRQQLPPGGRILQISSIATLFAVPMLSAMGASKCAVEGFTRAVAAEMKLEWDIKCTSVLVSDLDTDAHLKSMIFGDLYVPAHNHLDARAWTTSLTTDRSSMVDPMKAAKGILQLSRMQDPPGQAIIGKTVLEVAKMRLKADQELLAREDMVELAGVAET